MIELFIPAVYCCLSTGARHDFQISVVTITELKERKEGLRTTCEPACVRRVVAVKTWKAGVVGEAGKRKATDSRMLPLFANACSSSLLQY